MSKSIKIELELPEFEKELNISVTLKRDGEELTCSSHPEGVKTDINCTNPSNPPREIPQQASSLTAMPKGGNMMNLNF